MRKTETIKNILEKNIEELDKVIDFWNLSISFRGGKYYVKNNKRVIHRGNLDDIKSTFKNQKKFIVDVLSKKFKFIRDDKGIIDKVDDVTRNVKFIFKNHKIKIGKKILKICSYWNYDLRYKSDYMECLYTIFDIIWDNVDRKKIKVAYIKNGDYLIVDRVMEKYEIKINDTKVNLYCSNVLDEEIKKAVEFIKNLLNKKG